MDYLGNLDFTVKLPHENRLKAVIWDFASMRQIAIKACKDANIPAQVALTVAVRLSVDSTNLNRFVPIHVEGDRHFTNSDAKAMFSGPKSDPKTLTVNRFCAAFSPEISKYLSLHPTETWGQTQLEDVEPKFCFPHAYYLPNLGSGERKQIFAFLCHMDDIMSKAVDNWRSIAIKAAFYWKQKYSDKIKIEGRIISIDYKE